MSIEQSGLQCLVGREFRHGAEQNDYDKDEFAKDVIAHMPKGEEEEKDEK